MNEQLSLFKKWHEENTLVHVEIVIQKVGRKGIFGRLISIDEEKESIVLYDVDQKEVLSFMLNQIDSITPASGDVSVASQ
ncbi:hypothetical protein [Pueribacillus sp. YX66]|uniref:hypothetical protein n=1 Tax=Pueribacillus sp. YX66 TaxID=3229242 RepID=UPI00358D73A5